MIKTPKKQLFNPFLSFSRKFPPIKIFPHTIFFVIFYFILPFYYLIRQKQRITILFIFYFFSFLIIYYLVSKFYKDRTYIYLKLEEIQEKINSRHNQIDLNVKSKSALGFKINRYSSLKNIIQELNTTFDLASIEGELVEVAFNQIGRGKGVCLLYLVDTHNQRLNLAATKKEDANLIVKAKQGDIFDKWVLRHTRSLLVEDIKKDFRFDVEGIEKEHRRGVVSLIGSPMVSEERMFGIIRMDSADAQFFTEDDLRFLNTISDLGAVAFENFELFERTQELAIKDDLTALYRKGYFLERLKEEFNRSRRDKKGISLLMIDIDHFKDYNDKFGHTAGDIVLKAMAMAIIDFFKAGNALLCRFGGEEFSVALPDIKKKDALLLAERFRKSIQDKKIILRREETKITVSMGLAYYPDDALTEEELLRKADLALYQAKNTGRNKVCAI